MAGPERGQRKDKLIRDALRLAALRVVDGDPQGRTKLAIAAEQVVEAAVGGDLAAFKEIADRLDGRAVQQIDATHEINLHDGARDRLKQKLDRVLNPGANGEPSRVTH